MADDQTLTSKIGDGIGSLFSFASKTLDSSLELSGKVKEIGNVFNSGSSVTTNDGSGPVSYPLSDPVFNNPMQLPPGVTGPDTIKPAVGGVFGLTRNETLALGAASLLTILLVVRLTR